jgi:predicted lipoprotein with Yx(FWY)xxD motif
MGTLKRAGILFVFVMIIAAISSCGGGTGSTEASTSAAASTPTSAPTTAATTAPASTPTSTGNVVVKTASATVGGKSETILTDAKGMTLYYYDPDTASKTACTGGCAQNWPPLLFAATGDPAATPKLPGELEVYSNANGKQVIYNDHPLYTYVGDTAAGQTTGEGLGGKWHVATPDISKNAP